MQKTAILGLGKTGFSVLRYFERCAKERELVVMDSRSDCPAKADYQAKYVHPLYCGDLEKAPFEAVKEAIVSPGIQHLVPQLKKRYPGIQIKSDIDLFAEAIHKQGVSIIGITGSNGKSTVTTLTAALIQDQGLSVVVGGNLGTPALDLLPAPSEPWPDWAVLELSSFQLAITQYLPLQVATILNISPDHIDYHGSFEAYREAKCRIFRQAKSMVVNQEDKALLPYLPPNLPRVRVSLQFPETPFDFGLIQEKEDKVLVQGETRWAMEKNLKIRGAHNTLNALMALAILTQALRKQPNRAAVQKTLSKFRGLPHRCAWVAEKKGVVYINDSKGTNVGATQEALRGLAETIPGKWVLIAGGDGKGADFSPLVAFARDTVQALVLIGKDKARLQATFEKTHPCYPCEDLESAVLRASTLAKAGDGVLLSPACASLDMFQNYEERGQRFTEAVLRLEA